MNNEKKIIFKPTDIEQYSYATIPGLSSFANFICNEINIFKNFDILVYDENFVKLYISFSDIGKKILIDLGFKVNDNFIKTQTLKEQKKLWQYIKPLLLIDKNILNYYDDIISSGYLSSSNIIMTPENKFLKMIGSDFSEFKSGTNLNRQLIFIYDTLDNNNDDLYEEFSILGYINGEIKINLILNKYKNIEQKIMLLKNQSINIKKNYPIWNIYPNDLESQKNLWFYIKPMLQLNENEIIYYEKIILAGHM